MSFFSSRRSIMVGVVGMIASASVPVLAQTYPSRPIKILVGIGAGGATDSIARLYGHKLGELLGSSVIIENKPGGFQMPAIRALLNSPADGYTLFMGTGSSLAQAPGLRNDLGYDPLKDFTFVGQVGVSSAVFTINPELPVRNVKDLIAYSKANPGRINYGSAGAGTANHIKTEYFKVISGLDAVHIPYKSDTEVLREVAAGTLQLGLTTLQAAKPLIEAGKLRPVAITAPRELKYFPGVPGTEQVDIKGMDALEPYSFFGIVGPAGLPPEVVAKINVALNKVSSMSEVQSRMRDQFFTEPSNGTPEAFKEMTIKELSRSSEVGKRIQLTP